MNELLYIFNEICNRRNVKFVKVESVGFTMKIDQNLADFTDLLPIVTNTFYYIKKMLLENTLVHPGGTPALNLTNYGGGSPGDCQLRFPSTTGQQKFFNDIEVDNLRYFKNNITGGGTTITGTVFRVTFE